jgi:nonsense-mediated mRNA decay protein 3
VKLVDAGFIWTEPHSKRLKVKLTIQAEVFNGTILQQGFVVEFIVENHMCLECNRANANPNTWTACVQVRRRPAVLWRFALFWGACWVVEADLLGC